MSRKLCFTGSLTALIAAAAFSCGAAQAEPLFAFLAPSHNQMAPQDAPPQADRPGRPERE